MSTLLHPPRVVSFHRVHDNTIIVMKDNTVLCHEYAYEMCLDWIVQCFTSPPTQYRLYGIRFLQVKRPNQQYQRTEGSYKGKQHKEQRKHKIHMHRHTQKVDKSNTAYTYNTASPLVYNNMGWLGDGSHRGQGCQAWTAVGLPPRYPQCALDFY